MGFFMCARLLGEDFFHWEFFYKWDRGLAFCHLCRLGTYRFLYTHRRRNGINNRHKTLSFHCLSRTYNRAPQSHPEGTQWVTLINQTCLTKLVQLERLVLQRFPLVCVRIRSDLLGLSVSNRVTLTLPWSSAIARSSVDNEANSESVMIMKNWSWVLIL